MQFNLSIVPTAKSLALVFTLGAASAIPTSTSSGGKYCGKNFVDTFDSPTQQLSQASPVASTAGGALAYNGTNYGNQSPKIALNLLRPPSVPDAIAYAVASDQIRQGGLQPGWYLIPPPATDPDPGDFFAFFDQRRVCVACVTMDAGLPLGPPIACTVQFTGLKVGGVQVPVPVEAVFNPVVTPGQPAEFTCVDFPQKDGVDGHDGKLSWTRLIAVNVQLLQSSAGDLLTTVLLDNNTYTAYSRC